MLKRLASELAELLTEKKCRKEGDEGGRSSGSLTWRITRGEQTPGGADPQTVLRPHEKEFRAKLFRLTYNSAADEYDRPILKEKTSDWRSGVYSSRDIFRKEELDWKNVYLARREGTDSGEITWKIDCGHDTLKVASVVIRMDSTTFENGIVRGICCFGSECLLLSSQNRPCHRRSDVYVSAVV